MSEAERVEVLREFGSMLVLGVPVVWYVAAVFAACVVGMAWVAFGGRHRPQRRGEP